jgi:hypothetical protein
VPDEMRVRRYRAEERQPVNGEFVEALVALLLIIFGVVVSTVGVAVWVRPAAGAAILGLELFVVGCFMGNSSSNRR